MTHLVDEDSSYAYSNQASTKLPAIPKPIPPPKTIPSPGETSLEFDQTRPLQQPDINDVQRSDDETSYAHLAGPKGDFAVPTMSELGLKPATTSHRGGETVALSQLDNVIANESYTATFSKPETAPTAFSPQSTTLLSPHLHFGSLSCRAFYYGAKAVIDSYKSKAATIPTNLLGQLLFRDMYFGAQAVLGHSFSQTLHNPKCRFVPWHLPSIISPDTGVSTGAYDIDNSIAESWFQSWKFGRTGFPWIDALMRQLRQEGWIHHLGRHAVACFLTRGGCYVHWERGADVFAEWLIDHEVASNAGNWQWLSCTAFYAQFYRCYSPVAFPKKWDKEGKFVKRYVPELKNYSIKYIYEPWKAPIADQKKWGCLITSNAKAVDEEKEGAALPTTYPKPIFDFPQRREICIEALKHAYKVNLHGADEQVLDGSWKRLFGTSHDRIPETSDHQERHYEGVDEDTREAAETGEENPEEKEEEETNGRRGVKAGGDDKDGKSTGRKRRGGAQMTLEGAFSSRGKKRRRK